MIREQASIKTWGNSHGIRLSKNIMKEANMKDDDMLQIEASENLIIIRKTYKHKTFAERLAEYDGKMEAYTFDWGEPVGKEFF